MFHDYFWTPPPSVERQLGKPDQPIEYNLKHDNFKRFPRLSGKRLIFLKWLGRTGIGSVLRSSAARTAKFDLFQSIKLPDAPTLFPLPSKTPQRNSHPPVDFDKFIEESINIPKESSFKFVTIPDLIKEYRSHTVTPMQIAEKVIEIIKDTEKQNPKLRAIVQFDKDEILKMAAASTKRYAESNPLSVMDGVPVAVKEEFHVVPYYARCGTTFMGSTPSTKDASIVKKLRDGGAIIIGMSNMHELGIGTTGNNPNRLHGTPRNPYNVNYYTGGSSSGSAVAVAAGLCPVALGTDGGGSVRIPAAACGIVGIKASCGRISTSGEVPLAHTVSYTGPLCATVRDAALVYAFLAGEDQDDPKTLGQPGVTLEGFENISSLKGITVGVDWKYFKDCDADVHKQCEKAVKYLKGKGASVVAIQIPEMQETYSAHGITILSEMATATEEEFYKYYNEMNAETTSSLSLARMVTARDYFQAMKQRTRAMTFLKAIFEEEGVDCILTPGLATKVPEIPEDALEYGEGNLQRTTQLMRYMGLGNFTGIPGMTLPVGYDDKGLPIALQVMSSWWNEHVMLRVAHTVEGFVSKKKPQVHYNLLE
ncbi:hypothetical protein ACROYT_G020806 [Oculina patagonica]